MVARAVSPTSAATSTRFAAATIEGDFTAPAALSASNHGSARAEPMRNDSGQFCCKHRRARQGANREGPHHEETDSSRRAIVDIC